MVRHIKKITLLILLSLTLSSSPAHSMSYASGLWNATKTAAASLTPIAKSVGSLFSSIPSATSVAQGASQVVSDYYKVESGSLSHVSPTLIAFTPMLLMAAQGPLCKILNFLSLNKISSSTFNKALTLATTPISLAVHAYCLYNLFYLASWSEADINLIWQAWLVVRNADLLVNDTKTLLKTLFATLFKRKLECPDFNITGPALFGLAKVAHCPTTISNGLLNLLNYLSASLKNKTTQVSLFRK